MILITEGTILVIKETKRPLGWRVELKFQLALHNSDIDVLLKDFIGIGKIYRGKNNMRNFVITRIKDLHILTDHLVKYPLQTQKGADFMLFKSALELILIKDNKGWFT